MENVNRNESENENESESANGSESEQDDHEGRLWAILLWRMPKHEQQEE